VASKPNTIWVRWVHHIYKKKLNDGTIKHQLILMKTYQQKSRTYETQALMGRYINTDEMHSYWSSSLEQICLASRKWGWHDVEDGCIEFMWNKLNGGIIKYQLTLAKMYKRSQQSWEQGVVAKWDINDVHAVLWLITRSSKKLWVMCIILKVGQGGISQKPISSIGWRFLLG